MWSSKSNPINYLFRLSLLVCQFCCLQVQAASDPAQQLDDAYQRFSDQFYTSYLARESVPEVSNLLELELNIDDPIYSTGLIRKNLSLLETVPNHEHYYEVLAFLYDVNDTAPIKIVTDFLNKEGSFASRSKNYYLLARYYYERQNWDGVQAAVSKIDGKALADEDAFYMDMLTGFALQAKKMHRKAALVYKSIPDHSSYYAHAKLNEGTAYLRQGWWTEAHEAFSQAISSADNDQSEFVNRTLVVMGFSQLHHEFYRDSRATLRRVSLNSAFTNKAMLGLGVSAAYQEDFTGAINAFERLTASSEIDPSVDQSHLLLPPVYEERGDVDSAASSYQRAITFFEARINQLQQERRRLQMVEEHQFPTSLKHFEDNALNLTGERNPLPQFALDNFARLQLMKNYLAASNLESSLDELLGDYQSYLVETMTRAIANREEVLRRYQSQAKYGVAKLYDNS